MVHIIDNPNILRKIRLVNARITKTKNQHLKCPEM